MADNGRLLHRNISSIHVSLLCPQCRQSGHKQLAGTGAFWRRFHWLGTAHNERSGFTITVRGDDGLALHDPSFASDHSSVCIHVK